jgi:glucokinase
MSDKTLSSPALLLGADVGGTNLRLGLVDGMEVVWEKRFHADFSGLCKTHPADFAWQEIIRITSAAMNEALQQFPQITAVGIGFPGFIDPNNGHVTQSPNLPGLHDVDLAGDLAKAINRPVVVENDALAAAYGEFCLGQNTINGDLIYIGLGTGVGGGLIHASQPFAGQHGVAMEIGHLIVEPGGRVCGCGNHGCMEQYASASGVTISYAGLSGQKANAGEIAALAKTGDKHALAAYTMAGDKLAQGLAHILKVVDVGQVVIGGGVAQAWPLVQPAFDQRLQTDLIPVLRDRITIKISSNGDQAGIIGAALLAAIQVA